MHATCVVVPRREWGGGFLATLICPPLGSVPASVGGEGAGKQGGSTARRRLRNRAVEMLLCDLEGCHSSLKEICLLSITEYTGATSMPIIWELNI